MCEEGLTRDFLSNTSECKKCRAGWMIALIALALLAGLLIFFGILSVALDCEAEERLQVVTDVVVAQRICFTPALKQLLVYLTIWSSYGLQGYGKEDHYFLLLGKLQQQQQQQQQQEQQQQEQQQREQQQREQQQREQQQQERHRQLQQEQKQYSH
ncbi:hypothetical protein, conserved [Eimeria brunetti]|uniref:Uncharacterized protein n=1 Tax=Eimeria brunetti TaxID=51314 RepID=U6LZK4_9EIME|nr:hypothetical protein, conserved [Eimeria brunetti]